MNVLYPVSLKIASVPCLVVGGGTVATRKVADLLKGGARVTVLSPQLTEDLRSLHAAKKFTWLSKYFAMGDCQGFTLVFAATDTRKINEQIAEEAKAQGALVNVADDPEVSSFHVMSSFHRGQLCVAIGSQGASPSFSRFVKNKLSQLIGDEYGEVLEAVSRWRQRILTSEAESALRRKLFTEIDYEALLDAVRRKNSNVADEIERATQQLLQKRTKEKSSS